ncbi:MAG: methyltransferase domain-containing protein [Terriglobales bacterium]
MAASLTTIPAGTAESQAAAAGAALGSPATSTPANLADITHLAAIEAAVRRRLQGHHVSGNIGAARQLILQAFAAGVITPGLLSDLATLQVEGGELLAAERLLCLALTLAPESLAARRNLADLLLLTHRHELAVAIIRSILPRLPPHEQQRLGPHVEVHDRPGGRSNPYRPEIGEIWRRLQAVPGLRTAEWRIDLADFERFPCAHPWSAAPTYYEKKLQYYLSAAALQLTPQDRLLDVASQGSAFPGYARRIVGCDVYRQDLIYPPGRPHYLPGDAGSLPVEDGFFTAMTLHCSFEHFERDSDTRFIREAARVLRPGGRVCIVPLYMSTAPAERYLQTIPNGDAPRQLGPGCEFCRDYSPESLQERILAPAAGYFRATVFRMANLAAIQAALPAHQLLNSHFMLLLERR